MSADERFHDIVNNHFDRAFFWTRSCMLLQIGEQASAEHIEQIDRALKDRESIIRETAVWCLARLDPPDLRRRISTYLGDRSEDVARVARGIYSTLPEPDPT